MALIAQTVTTVGYGDVIPQTAFSKVVAVFVLTTALVTSAVMSFSEARLADIEEEEAAEDPLVVLRRIETRLDALERRLAARG
jgi:voltage-gated potassium channel